MDNADRAGEIVDRIRAHIKKAPPRNAYFDIDGAINDLIALARSEVVKSGVTVGIRLAEGLSPIRGDRVQLQQVVLNLILNAVEAMNSADDAPRELSISTERNGADAILVAVRDTGQGIDPEHLERVFELLLHHQAQRNGFGPFDLPLDRTDARRTVVGGSERTQRGSIPVHLAGRKQGFMNSPLAASARQSLPGDEIIVVK